jgi:L-threonylcarbamoyladenylate synthase
MALTLTVDPHTPDDRSLILAAEVVKAGGVLVYPTETLYGIGANAWDAQAIRKVDILKQRPDQKPSLVLVESHERMLTLVASVNAKAEKLIAEFWPGPLTLVFPASKAVPLALSKGSGTVGIRIPSSVLCRRLLQLAGCPISSSSANRPGEPPGTTIQQISASFPTGVDLYLDAGKIAGNLSSTVVDVSGPTPRIIRQGAITLERLQSVIPGIQ